MTSGDGGYGQVAGQGDPNWTTSGWGLAVKSQDQAFRAITRIGSLAAGRRYVWRGSSNRAYRVRSSLLRSLITDETAASPTELEMRSRELAILREAREWGLALEMGTLASDLYLLAHLQHHGVETRLLDVTSNPMTALWFACEREETAGVVFAFDVTDYPRYQTIDPHHLQTFGLQASPLNWSLRYALAVSAKRGKPFVLTPSLPNARMQAQEGLFISGVMPEHPSLAGVDGLPLPVAEAPGRDRLEALFAPQERGAGRPLRLPFCAIVIPAKIKKQIRRHLEGTYNRRQSTMYPDVDGFRRALADRGVCLDPPDNVVSAFEDVEAAPRDDD